MKVSDYIASFLKEKGIFFVFEMSGGMITHILDSINRDGNIRIVSIHHEQAAAFAADAVGRLTGKPGIAMATSGPGATNLITGIGSCYFDSSPAIFITGQVNRNELKGNRPIRQLGFQETDIVSIVKPITKAAWQIQRPEDVPKFLEKAFNLVTEGRSGPVLLDIPMDVQKEEISPATIKNEFQNFQKKNLDESLLKDLVKQLKDAKRPIILVGGGIHSSSSLRNFRKLVDKLKIPVVNSLMAVDGLPYDNPYRVGMIGSYGNRWANLAISKSDFLLVLGSRLDVRQTGSQTEEFKGTRTIYHIDCEKGEINNRIIGCIEIVSDLCVFFNTFLELLKNYDFSERNEWLEEIKAMKNSRLDTKELIGIKGINPNIFMHLLSSKSKVAALYVSDVGQHQMWAGQSLELSENQRFLTSGGMGSMGYGLPAAIGAAFTVFPQPVVLIAGDGGFQANIQELQTVFRNKLPIKMIILNNKCHGMVRQFQESYFEGRYQSTLWGYSAPNFELIASAYGIKSKTIKNESEINSGIDWVWENPNVPVLLQVMIDTYTNAYPKITFGKPNYEMEP